MTPYPLAGYRGITVSADFLAHTTVIKTPKACCVILYKPDNDIISLVNLILTLALTLILPGCALASKTEQ